MSAGRGFTHSAQNKEALALSDRLHYQPALYGFTTPRGNTAHMHYRLDTSDWNTLWSAMNEDEYHLRELPLLTGTAVDIGAHLGSVGIGLALDNPDLRVICVEPVPENAELLRVNAQDNGVADRVIVLNEAAAGPEHASTQVNWRYRGSELRDHHAFIGNAVLVEGTGIVGAEHESADVACVSLGAIISHYGPLRLLKIDCEGCEWSFLADPAVAEVPLILGEWHPTAGKTVADLMALLDETHVLSFSGPQEGPQEFTAVRR